MLFIIFIIFIYFYTFGFFWLADRLNWPLAGLAGWSGWLVWLAELASVLASWQAELASGWLVWLAGLAGWVGQCRTSNAIEAATPPAPSTSLKQQHHSRPSGYSTFSLLSPSFLYELFVYLMVMGLTNGWLTRQLTHFHNGPFSLSIYVYIYIYINLFIFIYLFIYVYTDV